VPGGCQQQCVTIGDIYHAGDTFTAIEAQLTAKETAPQPPGTS
jgi:hypothetical protein